jgi:hypothetical protein
VPEVNNRERPLLSLGDEASHVRGEPQTFYRYEDKRGKVVIVDSLSKLPPEAQQHAERLDLGVTQPVAVTPATGGAALAEVNTAAPVPPNVASGLGAAEFTSNAPNSAPGSTLSPHKFEFDSASFGLGLGAGLLLTVVLLFIGGRSDTGGVQRFIVRSALFVGVALLGSSAYLGWTRQHAGLGDAVLASPQQLMQDARGAVDQVKQRRTEQEQQLEEIKQLAK